jgi:hypothetical protein
MILITFFAGFNLQPISISVGLYIFKDIPLFLALIFFFILGAMIMVPFTILGKVSKKDLIRRREKRNEPIQIPDQETKDFTKEEVIGKKKEKKLRIKKLI